MACPSTGGGPVLVLAAETEKVGSVQVGLAKAVVPVLVVTETNLHADSTAKIPPPLFSAITSAPFPLLADSHAINADFSAAAPESELAYGKEKPETVFN